MLELMFLLLFFVFVFAVSIAVFPISELCSAFLSHQYQLKTVLKVLELLPIESMSAILENMFALPTTGKV